MVDYTQEFKQNTQQDPKQSAQQNKSSPAQPLAKTELQQIVEHGKAQWQIKNKWWFYTELLLLRIIYLAFYICFVTVMAFFLDCYELIFIIAFTFIVTANMKLLSYLVGNHTVLDSIPLVGHTLRIFRKLYIFYFTHKPPAFIYYTFYFPLAFITALFSFRVREELKLYCQIVYGITLLFIAKVAIYYFSIFPPYLSVEDAFVYLFVQIVMTTIITLAFVSPVISTSFVLHFTGHRTILKFINGLLLLLLLLFSVVCIDLSNDEYHASFLAEQTLKMRMEKSAFRRDLTEQTTEFSKKEFPQINAADMIFTDLRWSKKYRKHIEKLLATSEKRAFSAIIITDSDKQNWLFICCRVQQDAYLLYACDTKKNVYTSWRQLPEAIQQKFTVEPIADPSQPSIISDFSLIDESPLTSTH
ncbi:hypothetical protein [Candidatus Uabimicrobium amorphum]|uniref:Uncharacterized protein n=1 Tax=Uabimicrobium amorphum TaxID=2596890 RepID=A0A5S9IKB4_UABAM|nr:hypothetical protein [Candidatus Uabimicrobium amorphum]BBM83117.1 hypothetical protein UABAM_01468 [Candidatus Uabimicrobium amorphum]